MNWYTRQGWLIWALGLGLSTVAVAQTSGGSAAPTQGKVGVIKGDDVYVRSGFSTNYYPVTKLNRGDRVVVLGEEYGWLNIRPPAGTHSLIEKTFVEKSSDKAGTVKGSVWVFAGSNMDNRRYAKQVKLSSGDSVTILGQTDDQNFYKIAPPVGATLWVSADWVDQSGELVDLDTLPDVSPKPAAVEPAKVESAKAEIETVPPGELSLDEPLEEIEESPAPVEDVAEAAPVTPQPIQPTESARSAPPTIAEPEPQASIEPLPVEEVELAPAETEAVDATPIDAVEEEPASLDTSREPTFANTFTTETDHSEPASPEAPAESRKPIQSIGLNPDDKSSIQLNAIEAEIAAEETKPLLERDYSRVIEKLLPIADQEEDRIAHLYAEARLRGLKDHMDLINGLKRIQRLNENATVVSERYERERQTIRTESVAARGVKDIAVRGEIKLSGVYDGSGSRPRRWRIVDPAQSKTIAYIELPADSPIDPVQYYGKYVGVRASAHQVLAGTTPPLPVYTVREIVLLGETQRQSDLSGETPDIMQAASPAPSRLASPSSQPAGLAR